MSCPPPKDSASRHQRSALVSPKFLYFWHRPVLCAFLFLLLPLMSETSNSSDTQLSSSKSTPPPSSSNLLKTDGDSVAAPAAPQVSSSSKQGRGNAVTSNRTGGQAVSTGRKLTARSGRSSCNRSCTIQVGAGCVGGYLSVLIT